MAGSGPHPTPSDGPHGVCLTAMSRDMLSCPTPLALLSLVRQREAQAGRRASCEAALSGASPRGAACHAAEAPPILSLSTQVVCPRGGRALLSTSSQPVPPTISPKTAPKIIVATSPAKRRRQATRRRALGRRLHASRSSVTS